MRIRILSDLHVDVSPLVLRPQNEDMIVVAGDIGEALDPVDWLARSFPEKPVIYVPGNHEYYGTDLQTVDQRLQQSRHDRVSVLQQRVAVIGELRFLGCTLWTDFELHGGSTLPQAMSVSIQSVSDFSQIWMKTEDGRRMFRPDDAIALHRSAKQWLEEQLAIPFHGRTVVVTHHAPLPQSVHPRYAQNPTSSAFASIMPDLVTQADFWIHGHVHHSADYDFEGTRVICNPRGYVSSRGAENPGFNPDLVLEI